MKNNAARFEALRIQPKLASVIALCLSILIKEKIEMKNSRKSLHTLLALFALIMMASFALAADPGELYPATSEASAQKAGSFLFYPYGTSRADRLEDTNFNLTNTHSTEGVDVRVYFVTDDGPFPAGFFYLKPWQTVSFLASDFVPGKKGYVIAYAVDQATGCPKSFNWLIGDEFFNRMDGYKANLGAMAFSALYQGLLPSWNPGSFSATIAFTGVSGGYNAVPAVLALDSIGSPASGNDTLLILNRFGGNFVVDTPNFGAQALGNLFGLLFDDDSRILSFALRGDSHQLVGTLSNNFPRTNPPLEDFVPAGRTGWMKVLNQVGAIGILGVAIRKNPYVGAFNGGHYLHHQTLNRTASYIVPVSPPPANLN